MSANKRLFDLSSESYVNFNIMEQRLSVCLSVCPNGDLKNNLADFDETAWFGISMFQLGKPKQIETLNMRRSGVRRQNGRNIGFCIK